MKQRNWKHAVALALALTIVLSTGILNSGNWLHANEDETVAESAPAQEVVQETVAASQGNMVTEQIVLEPKPTEETKATEASEETKPADDAQADADDTEETTASTEETTASTEETAASAEETTASAEETTAPTEETTASTEETTASTEETTAPTEETTAPTEETTVPTEETQPILEAAELPLTVTLVDTEGNPVGDGTWTTTVKFAKGSTKAAIAAPKVAGYITPEAISVERTAETTELTATAVYEAEPETFTITVKIENAEQGEVKVNGEKVGDGFTQEMQEGETFTFTAQAGDNSRMTVTGAHLKDKEVPGEYIVETNVDKTVTITFKEKTPEELVAEALDPNRSVNISFVNVPENGYALGDTATLKADIQGYDNVNYTIQWRWSTDNATWNNVEGGTGDTLEVALDWNNFQYYWSILITITGLK